MSQLIPESSSQAQKNIVENIQQSGEHNVFTFAPVQKVAKIETQINIETQIIEISHEQVTKYPLIKASPYKGLKRFNFSDRQYFFGRDKLIDRLFKAVNENSLTFVLGASGSGKSSVIRAGLIPELKKSLISEAFYSFVFTPNQDPFESFYRCLLNSEKDYSFTEYEARTVLESATNTLLKVVEELKKLNEKWLIFIDQFEELFSNCHDLEKRKNFISGVVSLAKANDSDVRIILAMRSDFLEQFSFYPQLGAIANENNTYFVTEMYLDDLRQAIEQPAAKHGVVFEEGLVEQIIKDVEGQSGYLPLLQYTLDLLWESECRTKGSDGHLNIEDRTLNKSSYTALEGARGALQKRVNQIYRGLDQDEQVSAKQIFLKLVNILETESGSRAVSRRAYRDEFVGQLVEDTLNIFVDENLLVSSYEYSNPERLLMPGRANLQQHATIEIAHEILLSSWDELRQWLEEEKEAIILKNWLAGETRRWLEIRSRDKSKANDELLKGARLDQIVAFRNKKAFDRLGGLVPQENEFIDASVEYREQLLKAAEKRRRRQYIVALATSAFFAAFSAFAGIQWRAAEINQIRALARSSESLLLSEQDLDALTSILKAGTRLNHPFLRIFRPQNEFRAQIRATLQQVVYGVRERQRLEIPDRVISASFISDGTRLAIVQQQGRISLWDTSGRQLAEFHGPQGDIRDASFSPDGTTLITVSSSVAPEGYIVWDSSTVRLWNLESKEQIAEFKGHQGEVWSVSFSPNGSEVATGGDDGVRLWNLQGEQLPQFKGGQGRVTDLAFSPEGNLLATVGDQGVLLWNLEGEQVTQLEVPQRLVSRVIFEPNGMGLVTEGVYGTEDYGTIRLWDFQGNQVGQFQGILWGIVFSPNGDLLAGTGERKHPTPGLWNLSGKQIAEFKGHRIRAEALVFSPDGQQLVTAGADNTVRLWDLQEKQMEGKRLAVFREHREIFSMVFSPDGSLLASSGTSYENEEDVDPVQFPMGIGRDNAISIWDLQGNKLGEVPRNQGNSSSLNWMISPDNQRLAIAEADGTARLWNWRNEQQIAEFREPPGSSLVGVSFSGERSVIITRTEDNSIQLWNWEGEQLAQFKDNQGEVYQVTLSPDGSKIATTGNEGVHVWDWNGTQVAKVQVSLGEHDVGYDGVVLSGNGSLVAITGREGVRVWNWDGKLVAQINGVGGESFSPDGRFLVTSGHSFYNTVRIWDLESQQALATFTVDHGSVFDAKISPDGKYLVIVDNGGYPTLWRFESFDELMERGCNWVRDYLRNNPNVDESDRTLCL